MPDVEFTMGEKELTSSLFFTVMYDLLFKTYNGMSRCILRLVEKG